MLKLKLGDKLICKVPFLKRYDNKDGYISFIEGKIYYVNKVDYVDSTHTYYVGDYDGCGIWCLNYYIFTYFDTIQHSRKLKLERISNNEI